MNNAKRGVRGKSGSLAALVMTMSALVLLMAAMGCNSSLAKIDSASLAGDWHDFQGTWTAAGTRTVLRLGEDRRASISNMTGSLVLSGKARPAVGFRAEAIVFNDTTAGVTGRAVWTDERGEKVYSELRSEPNSNAVVGTFAGGTGRYAGAAGSYEFTWRFMLEQEDGTVQGQADGLKGRVRVGSAQESQTGGPQR